MQGRTRAKKENHFLAVWLIIGMAASAAIGVIYALFLYNECLRTHDPELCAPLDFSALVFATLSVLAFLTIVTPLALLVRRLASRTPQK